MITKTCKTKSKYSPCLSRVHCGLYFSDLESKLQRAHPSAVPLPLAAYHSPAVNLTKGFFMYSYFSWHWSMLCTYIYVFICVYMYGTVETVCTVHGPHVAYCTCTHGIVFTLQSSAYTNSPLKMTIKKSPICSYILSKFVMLEYKSSPPNTTVLAEIILNSTWLTFQKFLLVVLISSNFWSLSCFANCF